MSRRQLGESLPPSRPSRSERGPNRRSCSLSARSSREELRLVVPSRFLEPVAVDLTHLIVARLRLDGFEEGPLPRIRLPTRKTTTVPRAYHLTHPSSSHHRREAQVRIARARAIDIAQFT